MDFRKQKLAIEEVKKIDITNYLSSLGFQPAKIRNFDFWYNSPLRNENKPSFKVNQKLNLWFDHGLGKGGNIIDFGLLYHKCDINEFLEKINANSYPNHQRIGYAKHKDAIEGKLKIVKDVPLSATLLLRYLEERKIPLEIARQFCSEIRYETNGKNYYGIGFKNDSGGYEIRNRYAKISSSPKDITSINNGAKVVAVFEGFIDFLSFKATTKNLPEKDQDFVVLNSVYFFERARPFMENHQSIRLYLDRDSTGINCTQRALSLSTKYKDESHLYKNFNDYNDYLIHSSKAPRKHLRRKL